MFAGKYSVTVWCDDLHAAEAALSALQGHDKTTHIDLHYHSLDQQKITVQQMKRSGDGSWQSVD